MGARRATLRLCLVLGLSIGAACSAPKTAARAGGSRWIGTWAAAPQPYLPGALKTFRDQTVRLVVHTSVGGPRVRVRLSNLYGERPLEIGAARIARRTSSASIEPGSDRTLTFAGAARVTVGAGESVTSDAVALEVPALADLAVSLYFSVGTPATTSHLLALQTSFLAAEPGDKTAEATLAAAKPLRSWPFLTGVEVEADPPAASVVAFGDSWFDGDGSTADANHRLPDRLAERLHGRRLGSVGVVGVLNEGLIGNRLLRDSPRDPPSPFGGALGESGLGRFERDALDQPGVRVVVVHLGVNDLGLPGALAPEAESPSAADLEEGFGKLAALAHARKLRVVATTIGPFEGATQAPAYFTPEKDARRREVNSWLTGSREFDAVVDLDRLLRDPDHPARLLPAYDSGDHLHPNDAGYAAAAEAIYPEVLRGLE